MLTFSDLLTYTLVLIEVITLVVILSDKKTKKITAPAWTVWAVIF